MNKLVLFVGLFLVSSLTINAQKIGYINSLEILTILPDVKAAATIIEVMILIVQKKGK